MNEPKLRDYSKAPIEILIAILTVVPIVVLASFYAEIPDRIPVFLNLRGEVEVWTTKRIASVFRVPAMALDLQLICLLMKYGTVKSQGKVDRYEGQATILTATFWDWIRCLVAFKMAAASLDILLVGGTAFLTTLWMFTWLAAIVSIVAASMYGYKLWQIKRRQKNSREVKKQTSRPRGQLIAGLIYFNPKDPAVFDGTYLLNFGNKWVYPLIASLVAYPLLVFVPT